MVSHQDSVTYSLICRASWKNIKITGGKNLLLEEKDEKLQLYGVKIMYRGKNIKDKDETAEIIFYSESEEQRDEIKKLLDESASSTTS